MKFFIPNMASYRVSEILDIPSLKFTIECSEGVPTFLGNNGEKAFSKLGQLGATKHNM